jgi:molecular chaperone DnaK (HSP70)
MSPRFVIGIDLGTTNTVVAFATLTSVDSTIEVLSLDQFVAPQQTESRRSLPSFLYLPPHEDVQQRAYQAAWCDHHSVVCGELARRFAADHPQRVVVAAKSWLCHRAALRHDPILPFQAPEEVDKVSPVEATQRLLEHVAGCWHRKFPDAPIDQQRIVLCVPASFDPDARELTLLAAQAAGLPSDVVLLEEPQAAVYRWLAAQGDQWRRVLQPEDQLLVVDVGGGTTDLTLVRVHQDDGNLTLQRLAVGNHLLVGGDNMDLALAHFAAQKFHQLGKSLDPWQSVSLWHACRQAKEQLLADDGLPETTISILGRGSRLIGGTISVPVTRDEAIGLLVDGFFPLVPSNARPQRHAASGFQDIGLPYESDPAITKHVARFVAEQGEGRPTTHVLFNGGVFKAPRIRQRLIDALAQWNPHPPKVLGGREDLDESVAIGAAFYGLSQLQGGIRIRGGTARSYYVGIEAAGLAIPGMPRPLRALCVASQGMEEGSSADVPGGEVGLIVGQNCTFRFFASSARKNDHVGTRLDRWSDEELSETAPIELSLPREAGSDDDVVPVRLHAKITELGVFELYCRSLRGDQQWKMAFNVRE